MDKYYSGWNKTDVIKMNSNHIRKKQWFKICWMGEWKLNICFQVNYINSIFFFISGFSVFVKEGSHREHQLFCFGVFLIVFFPKRNKTLSKNNQELMDKGKIKCNSKKCFCVFVFINETRLCQRTFKGSWT